MAKGGGVKKASPKVARELLKVGHKEHLSGGAIGATSGQKLKPKVGGLLAKMMGTIK
jgi:hypothetical protein